MILAGSINLENHVRTLARRYRRGNVMRQSSGGLLVAAPVKTAPAWTPATFVKVGGNNIFAGEGQVGRT